MHSDIDECAEINNIANRSLQLHAGLEVVDIHDIGAQKRRRKLVTRIASGLLELFDYILKSGQTYL